jgi:2-dehydro-3-deoxy-D-arabinonate dehydratase
MIVRYLGPTDDTGVGLLDGDHVHPLSVGSVAALLQLPGDARRAVLAAAGPGPATFHRRDVRLLPPADGRMEVWACGVTYTRSREARMEESEQSADVYDRVYDAARPEVFFKSTAWRTVGHRGTVTVRRDSRINVPEPELAVVVDAHGEIAGYTICDDVSSRDIEGENPLYLPQAKVWLGSCAIGPGIVPAEDVADPYALAIQLEVHRDGELAFSGSASSAQLHRRLDELAAAVLTEHPHPDGVIVSTGTGIVPGMDFTLLPGDEIAIFVEGIGTLRTWVGLGHESVVHHQLDPAVEPATSI